MPVLERPSTAQKIRLLIAEIEAKRQEIQDEEIEGWLIRRASPFEISDHLGTMTAESRPGCSAPLTLPHGHEVLIAVLQGAVQIDGRADPLTSRCFWVVREGDGRDVVAIQHPTKIACSFFLGDGDGSQLDSRATP